MIYTIQKGDTLSALAKRFNTTVDLLAKTNNIKDPNKIYVGDKISVPSGKLSWGLWDTIKTAFK